MPVELIAYPGGRAGRAAGAPGNEILGAPADTTFPRTAETTGVPTADGNADSGAPPTEFGMFPTGAEYPGGGGGGRPTAAGGGEDEDDEDVDGGEEADTGAATLAGMGAACTDTRAGAADGAIVAGATFDVGAAPTIVDAAATLAMGVPGACAVACVTGVVVGGAFVGAGVGVQIGRGVGLAVIVAGASPSRRPMICGAVAVAVGGSAVGDGPGVPVAGVPVGIAVGVTQGGVPFVAAPAALPDPPITAIMMHAVMALVIRIIHRRARVLSPCISAPSFSLSHPHATPCPMMPVFVKSHTAIPYGVTTTLALED